MTEQCPSENELLSYLRHALTPREAARLEQHLDRCRDCHRLVVELARAGGRIVPRPSLPSGESTHKPGEAAPGEVALKPGAAIGRYTVIERLGEGGMGVVFAAYDRELDRKVALKVSRSRPGRSSGQEQTLMLAEAKALARLSSPHVVAIYDVGQIDAQVFLSMELIEGQTLRGWLLEKERSWREVLKAFVEAGKGLAAAHSAGLVHRDFKPENVLVGRDGRVRVTDFGLALDDGTRASGAKSRSSSSTLGSRAGTPAYMAPSQLEGGEVDTRNDQFAFCVALYEALYGVRPFKAPTKRTRVVFPPEPELPARVRRALARGLAHDPERRFPSIPALLGALKRSRGKKRKGSAVALPSGVTALRPGRSSSDQGFTSSLH